MKLMTWNIKDGGVLDFRNPNLSNIQNILGVVENEAPDVLVMQEYQSEFYNDLILNGLKKQSYTFSVCEEHPDKTLRKRVLIASKKPIQDIETTANILAYSRRNWREVVINLNEGSVPLHLLGVHVPLAETTDQYGSRKENTREKKIFLDALQKKFIEYRDSDEPCVICGDFNLHSEAVYKEYLEDFYACLTEVTTPDATHRNHKFDYIFTNKVFVNHITNGNQVPKSAAFSDHSYLCVEWE